MSGDRCSACGATYRGEHECTDGAALLERIQRLEDECAALRVAVKTLASYVGDAATASVRRELKP